MPLSFLKPRIPERPAQEQAPPARREQTEQNRENFSSGLDSHQEEQQKKQEALRRSIQQQAIARPKPQLPKSPLRRQLETVLAEDVFPYILEASPDQQRKIRAAGRATVDQIETMKTSTKIKIGRVIKLILAWLKLLPINNPYYLEQEAKIKAEQILRIVEEKHDTL